MQLRHLVLVVPGIGGSTLVDDGGHVRWGGGLTRFVGGLLMPEPLSLEVNAHLRPVGMLTVASHLPGLAIMHPYDRLLRKLGEAFDNGKVDAGDPAREDLGATVVAFPYDFRRSVAEAADALATAVGRRLATLAPSGITRVIVVAHSMGGLVARYWIGRLGGWQVCDALTTLGTPHRGAPKAADWLVNGATVKGCRLDGATEVLRSWPSVYELLPTYKAVALGSDAYGYCHELAFAPLDGADAKAAAALHADIAAGWQAVPTGEGALEVKPVYGFGHDTAMALVVAPDGVRSTVDDAARVDGAELKGDGTVPWVSAIPPELSEEKRAWQAAALRHGVLTDVDGVVEFVKTVTAPGSLADVRGAAEPDDRPAVGTQGLETETIAGERLSFTLTVRGYPDDIDPSAWAVSLKPVVPDPRTPPAPGAVPTIVVEPARTTALVRTGPLAPGRYDLTIRARLDLDTDPLPIRESVLVVEP